LALLSLREKAEDDQVKRAPLQRRSELRSSPNSNATKPARRAISLASRAQREKARTEPCVVTGEMSDEYTRVDPAHLVSRAQGGCDDPLCVVPLVRHVHSQFDMGRFDLLPYLVNRRVPELCHALEHLNGDLVGLYRRLTGTREIG
jgi:hypothetical protein